jgi:hypothetical protein
MAPCARFSTETDVSKSNPNLLAFDADGVLIDYHEAYALAWERAFGHPVPVVDPLAYWPKDRYGLRHLSGSELEAFRAQFNHGLWSNMSALPGAAEGLGLLKTAGYDLVCVSAVRPEHRQARADNLRSLGLPIDEVISCHGEASLVSPKAAALARLMPAAFVDDYLPYLRGVHSAIHTALIDRSPHGSPNVGDELALARSTHSDILDFSRFWLSREHP